MHRSSARNFSRVGLLAGSLLLLVSAARAVAPFSPAPWATAYATKRAGVINVDGDLSEWAGVRGVKMAEDRFFFVGQGMSSAKWKGLADLSGTFKLQWDADALYIAVEVVDDVVNEPHGALAAGFDTGSWDDDGVEVMLDTDGCGMPRYYVGDPLHHEFHFVYGSKRPLVFDNFWKPEPGATTPMFKLPDGSEEPLAYPGEAMVKNEVTDRFGAAPYHGQVACKRTEKGYTMEIRLALPGATMKAINDGGRPIGFDLTINDTDAGSGPLKQQLHWSGISDLYWRNCQCFGTLLLLNQ